MERGPDSESGGLSRHVVCRYTGFHCRAKSWSKPRRIVAGLEFRPREPVPRVGFIVTKRSLPNERVPALRNDRGTAEQHIKEGIPRISSEVQRGARGDGPCHGERIENLSTQVIGVFGRDGNDPRGVQLVWHDSRPPFWEDGRTTCCGGEAANRLMRRAHRTRSDKSGDPGRT